MGTDVAAIWKHMPVDDGITVHVTEGKCIVANNYVIANIAERHLKGLSIEEHVELLSMFHPGQEIDVFIDPVKITRGNADDICAHLSQKIGAMTKCNVNVYAVNYYSI